MVSTPQKPQAVQPGVKVPAKDTILTPRFYTTDFDAMAAMDISANEEELAAIIEEFRVDYNRHHFVRDEEFNQSWDHIDGKTRELFIEFLERSCTAEFSGFLLYKELSRKLKGKNPVLAEGFELMSRDEARHAGFLNKAMTDFNLSLDLGFLTQSKSYTHFAPKFIFYATYLSEKIGYARYITIFRQLQRHPEREFHPIFRWFEKWCNDEFRHGEAFALIMRAHPHLLSGVNKLWIRFFQLAVYATMYIRDHSRVELHKAFGIDPTEYDYEVFRITAEISRQVFPLTLDIDNPKFRAGLERLRRISNRMDAARAKGGIGGLIRRAGLTVAAGAVLGGLFLRPARHAELPAVIRLAPAW